MATPSPFVPRASCVVLVLVLIIVIVIVIDSNIAFESQAHTMTPLPPHPRRLPFLPLASVILLLLTSSARADSFAIIICGKGGDAEYAERFADWGTRLLATLTGPVGLPPANTLLLLDPSESELPAGARPSTLDGIRAAFTSLAPSAATSDSLFIILIGHGSYQNGQARFNIPGPDLSPADLESLISPLPAAATAIINASSSSAAFINLLSAPGRIICTATRNVEQRNATEFMEHFIQGLTDQSADQNRDGRIAILEACQQAAALTEAAYIGKGLILTENALLDDDGDGLGTRLQLGAGDGDRPTSPSVRAATSHPVPDGTLAARLFLKDFIFPPSVPRELIDGYRDAIDAVEALKARKPEMPPDEYAAELETLLLRAARLNRDIHRSLLPAGET